MTGRRQQKTDAGERARRDKRKRATLRVLRGQAHLWFDLLWRDGYMSRSFAYGWLMGQFDLTPDQAHMSRLNHEQLLDVPRRVRALIYRMDPRREPERV